MVDIVSGGINTVLCLGYENIYHIKMLCTT